MSNIEEVTMAAAEKFWEHVAQSFPEIKSGDLCIDTTLALDDMMLKAVREWVVTNSN